MSYELWSEMIVRAQNSEAMAKDKGLSLHALQRSAVLVADFLELLSGPLKETEYALRARSELRKQKIGIPLSFPLSEAPEVARAIHLIIRDIRNLAEKDGFEFNARANTNTGTTNNYNQNINASTVINPTNSININLNITARDIILGLKKEIENDSALPKDRELNKGPIYNLAT